MMYYIIVSHSHTQLQLTHSGLGDLNLYSGSLQGDKGPHGPPGPLVSLYSTVQFCYCTLKTFSYVINPVLGLLMTMCVF